MVGVFYFETLLIINLVLSWLSTGNRERSSLVQDDFHWFEIGTFCQLILALTKFGVNSWNFEQFSNFLSKNNSC